MTEIIKPITYFGREAVVGCDNNCRKAWGINLRPRVYFDRSGRVLGFESLWHKVRVPKAEEDLDNFAYVPDHLLADAPADPGSYEGGQGKPPADYPPCEDKLNKWCVRECERNQITECGKPEGPLVLPRYDDFRFNMPATEALVTSQDGWRERLAEVVRAAWLRHTGSRI
jgi:hypothetical protein